MKLASQLEAKNFWSSFYNIPVNNFHLSRANSRADDSRTWNRYERTTFRRQEIFYVFIVQYFNDRNACFLFFYSYKLIWINFLGTVECINFFIVSYCETGQLQHAARCSCSQFSFSSLHTPPHFSNGYLLFLVCLDSYVHTRLHDQFTFQSASLNGLCLLCKLSSFSSTPLNSNNRKNFKNNTSK